MEVKLYGYFVRRHKGSEHASGLVPRLLALNPGNSRAREFVLAQKEQVFVGSDEATNDLALPVNGVSRRHASIIYGDGRYRIIDLNSTNGTFVNGRRVDSTILQNGDEIRFGPACFVFSASPADREGATSPAKQVLSHSRSLSVRTLAEIVLIAFVVGFGAAQYIAYLFYHEQNRLLLAKAEPFACSHFLQKLALVPPVLLLVPPTLLISALHPIAAPREQLGS